MSDLLVGVVGAGAMGGGIAQVAAAAGHNVVLADANAGAVERARGIIIAAFQRQVERGKLEGTARDAILGRIRFVDARPGGDLRLSAGCGLVIVVVYVALAIQRELY